MAEKPNQTDQEPEIVDPIDVEEAEIIDDPDMLALQEMEKAAEAEENPEPVPADEPDPEPEPTPEEPKPDAPKGEEGKETPAESTGEAPTVPKPRLDEALRKNDELALELAFYKGAAQMAVEGRKDGGNTSGIEERAQPSPEDRIAAVHAQMDALAAEYDEGDLTMKEFKSRERELRQQEDAIRIEMLEAKAPAEKPDPVPSSADLYLEEKTDAIEAAHPLVKELPDDDPRWNILVSEAVRELTAEGMRLVDGDPRSTLAIRKRMAELGDTYIPIWTGKTAEPSKPDPKPDTTNLAGDRKSKLDLARTMPPELGDVGNSGAGHILTREAIENMSDEDLAALSEEEVERALNSERRSTN